MSDVTRPEAWRDRILQHFPPGAARLTVVTDPDGLILDEAVLGELRGRQIEVLVFEDPVSFRYAYESRCRTYWDDDKPIEVVVVSRQNDFGSAKLPWDVMIPPGRRLLLGLQELFPGLSRTVVAALGSAQLDVLYRAVERERPDTLGDGATKDFILRHVFGISAKRVREPEELLRHLLRIHYDGQSIPPLLSKRLVQGLRTSGGFEDWPLDVIVPDRDAFFAFLQERWRPFLDRVSDTKAIADPQDPDLAYSGPIDLPFDHDRVRVYIDNLFIEGFLRPVAHEAADSFAGTSIAAGVQSASGSGSDDRRRLAGLVKTAAKAVPGQDARYDDWLRFARKWAETVALELAMEGERMAASAVSGDDDVHRSSESAVDVDALRARVDEAFGEWLGRRYAGLANLPPVPPIMLHHVPHLLARHLDEAPQHKAALLVVDGLSMDQWVAVREELTRLRPDGYRFREDAVFAWIPTLTSVSRQAAFAGRQPFYFPPGSIHSTSRELKLWRRFWADCGLADNAVVYQKKLGDGPLDATADLVSGPRIRVAGLVVDKVDKVMHGMELGARGMHGQVRQWTREGNLAALLDLLLDNGFRVWLTSDHGNVEAKGCGSPAGGAVSDLRGKRVHVYPNKSLRRRAADEFPDARPWHPTGLPADYLPLLAPGRSAFVAPGKRIVGHGGASLEEVVVPLVRIDRSADA